MNNFFAMSDFLKMLEKNAPRVDAAPQKVAKLRGRIITRLTTHPPAPIIRALKRGDVAQTVRAMDS
jgi:hypothetical protein